MFQTDLLSNVTQESVPSHLAAGDPYTKTATSPPIQGPLGRPNLINSLEEHELAVPNDLDEDAIRAQIKQALVEVEHEPVGIWCARDKGDKVTETVYYNASRYPGSAEYELIRHHITIFGGDQTQLETLPRDEVRERLAEFRRREEVTGRPPTYDRFEVRPLYDLEQRR